MFRNFKHNLLLIIVSLWGIPFGMSQTWLPMDKGINCFYTGNVKKILADSAHDKLYISGTFSQEGNCASLRGLASWDGAHWNSIGIASDGNPTKFAMTVYNNTLYSAGIFYNTTITQYLAAWNGSSWDTLPNTYHNGIMAFVQKDNLLYMAGSFDHPDNDSTFLLAKYDGTTFSRLNPYYSTWGSSILSCMTLYQDTLYVGGKFGMQPGKNIANFAKWDGSEFQSVSSEFANYGGGSNIYSLAVYHNELYIAGYFRKVDGYTGDYIMKWDGHQLTEVGTGTDDLVTCMKVYNDALYIGGYFTHAGGIVSNHVAKWDGTNWTSVTTDTFTGSYPLISDIGVYKDSLIIAGNFIAINGDSTINCIAKYSVPLTGINESTIYNKASIYPNPSTNQITIEFSEAVTQTTILQIKNTLGQTIKTVPLTKGNKQLEIDISDLTQGFYFVQLQSGNRMISKKFIKQ